MTVGTSRGWSSRCKGVGAGEPTVDQDEGAIRIPVGNDGSAALLDSVRRLDDIQIVLADIALHRPTLDDVFLSLTGRSAEHGADPELTPTDKPKRPTRTKREEEDA